MNIASKFLQSYNNVFEVLKKGSNIQLVHDIESDDGLEIPRKSIVTVLNVVKEKGKYHIDIESIDGETATLVINKLSNMKHKVL